MGPGPNGLPTNDFQTSRSGTKCCSSRSKEYEVHTGSPGGIHLTLAAVKEVADSPFYLTAFLMGAIKVR